MSSILKGLNESTYRSYDDNRTGFSRGPRDDERHDLDVQQPSKQEWALKINGKVWSKDGKAVTFASKEQALKARQSLLARRPELEVGLVTRNGVAEAGTGLDIDRSIPGRTIARVSDTPGKNSSSNLADYNKHDDEYDAWSGKVGASIHDDEEDTFDTDYTGDEEGELNEISNEKLAQYKTAAAADAKKADSEGDYKRGDKRFSGIVKATKKQFANDEKKSAIGQGLKEVDSQKEFILYINGKPAAKYVDQMQAEKDIVAVNKKYPKSHLELKYEVCDLETIKKVNEGESILRPTTGQVMQTRNKIAQKIDPNRTKFVWKRPNQINGSHSEQELISMGFRKSSKYNMWGGTQDMWSKISESLDETLGDQLKSKSLEALSLLKQQIEQKRAEDLAQWEQDFRNNVANKMRTQQIPSQEVTPVAQPGEKHSVLKARLVQLNNAIEKQALLDKLIGKLERKGLMTPAMQNDTDTRMHVKYGAKDNYQSLNKKLDNAIAMLQNRLNMRKLSGLKEEDELNENCWKGYHKEGNKELFGKTVPNCVKNEGVAEGSDDQVKKVFKKNGKPVGEVGIDPEASPGNGQWYMKCYAYNIDNSGYDSYKEAVEELKYCLKQGVAEEQHSCPHCGGEMVSEELMNEKKDACYYKVKSRYKVWPSAYASGALVKCRKKGASNWGNGGKKNESSILEGIEQVDENLHKWFKEKWVRFGPDGKIRGDCARGDDSEGKPKCLPQSKAHSLGKKGRASAASRKRREDPNPERSGKAINVNTKKKSNESIDEGWKDKLGAAALAGSMALGAGAAHSRVTPDGQGKFTGGLKPTPTVTAPSDKPAAEAPKGFSKEYLQKAADPNRTGRYMISVEKAQELLKQMNEDQLDEKWSQKYKDSINCSNPKGFSQKAHCQGKNK